MMLEEAPREVMLGVEEEQRTARSESFDTVSERTARDERPSDGDD
jgi:hypothetical protein